jgi:hypothetical protein
LRGAGAAIAVTVVPFTREEAESYITREQAEDYAGKTLNDCRMRFADETHFGVHPAAVRWTKEFSVPFGHEILTGDVLASRPATEEDEIVFRIQTQRIRADRQIVDVIETMPSGKVAKPADIWIADTHLYATGQPLTGNYFDEKGLKECQQTIRLELALRADPKTWVRLPAAPLDDLHGQRWWE